eukprot:2633928-Alexandrium_andersonii.AAC.1
MDEGLGDDILDEPGLTAGPWQSASEEHRGNVGAGGAEDDEASAKMAIAGIRSFFQADLQERVAEPCKPAKRPRSGHYRGGNWSR